MAGVSLKIDANSKSFQAEMKAMVAQMKLVTSEYKLSAAQAKAMGSSVDALKAKETELTAKIGIQNNIIDAYEGKLKDQKTVLQQLQDEENRLKLKKEQLTKAYEESVRATGEDSEESKKLKAQLDETEQAHAKAEKAVEKQKTAIQNNTTKLYENRAKLNDLNGALETNQQQLKDAENGMDNFSDEVEDAGKNLDEAGEKSITFGDLIKANVISDLILKGVEKLADGIKSIAESSIETGMQFESTMSEVQAISGATGDDMQRLTEKAQEMGASTSFSATEAGEAFTYMAMAGWKTGDMLDGVEGIMNLAAASGEDLATTSDIVTDALTGFGMTAADSGRFADVLAAASSNANTNVSMLGESFKYVAPVAGALGYSAEDTSVALGLMANSGIKASQAGTALRTLLTNMAKPTDKMATAMEKLGVSLADDEGNMYSLADIMGKLRSGFKDLKMPEDEFNASLSELEEACMNGEISMDKFNKGVSALMKDAYGAEGALKAEAAATLAGKEGMSGLLAIVNASDEDFKKLSDAIYDSSGAAEDMAQIRLDNLQGQVTLLKSAAEGFSLAVFSGMAKPLTNLATQGQEAISTLTGTLQTEGPVRMIQSGMQMMTAFTGGIVSKLPGITQQGGAAISGFMSAVSESFPSMMTVGINAVSTFISGIGAQLPQLIPQGLQMVVSLANAAIRNIPTLVDAGIALVTGLAQGIINSIPIIVQEAPRIINDFWDMFDGNLGKILLAGGNLIIQLAKGLIDSLPLIKKNAGEIIKAIFNTIMHINFLNAGKTLMTNLKSGISAMKSSLGTTAKNIGNNALQQIKNINWLSLGKTVVTFIKNGVTGAAGLLGNALKAVGTKGLNVVKNINWISLGKTVITFVKNGVTGAAGLLGNALKAAGKGAITALKNIDWRSVGSAIVNGIKNGLKTAASGLASAAVEMAKNALGSIKDALGIHSPSRVFKEQVGLMMGAGIQLGFKESMQDARTSMAKSMQTLVPDITADVNPVMQIKKSAVIKQNDINETRKLTTNDITSRTDETLVINQTNVTYLDGEEISRKTTKRVVKKISRDEKNRKIYKGEFVMA